jgi:hypothetical protein
MDGKRPILPSERPTIETSLASCFDHDMVEASVLDTGGRTPTSVIVAGSGHGAMQLVIGCCCRRS